MHPASEQHIPDGLLAASVLLAEKPRQGSATYSGTHHQGFGFVISHTSLGIIGPLYDGRIRSRCTGKERDTESGLDYFGARYMSSNMGRFMSPDWSPANESVPYADLTNPQSLNLYSYALNSPQVNIDSDGHTSDMPNEWEGLDEDLGALNHGDARAGKELFSGYAHVVNSYISDSMNAYGYSDRLVKYVEGWEGLRKGAYDDGFGNTTVGYGITGSTESSMSDVGAVAALMGRLNLAARTVLRSVEVQLHHQYQFDSLVDVAFNTGGIRNTSLLSAVDRGQNPAIWDFTKLSWVKDKHLRLLSQPSH